MVRRLSAGANPHRRAGPAFFFLLVLFLSLNALILGVCCYHTLRQTTPTWTTTGTPTWTESLKGTHDHEDRASAAASMHIQLVDAGNPPLALSQAQAAVSRLRARFLHAGDTLLVGVIAGCSNTSLVLTTMQSLLALSGTRTLLYIPARCSGYGEDALRSAGRGAFVAVRGAFVAVRGAFVAVRGTHHAAPCVQNAGLCPALDFAQLAGFAWTALAPRYMLFVDAGSVLMPPDGAPVTPEDHHHHPVRLIAWHQQNRTAVCRHTYHEGLETRRHPWSSTLFEGPELPRLAGLIRRFAAGPLTLTRLFQEACDLRPGAVGVVVHTQPRFGWSQYPEPPAVEDGHVDTAGLNAAGLNTQDALSTHWDADVAFVIPTVSRPGAFYINDTVSGLARAIRAASMESRSLIIVQVSGASADLIEAHYIKTLPLATLPLASGRAGGRVAVEVHKAPIHTYPDLEHATKFTYGDSPARVRWRSQQNLDYAALFGLAQHRARFVVMMEDDVTPVSDTVVAEMWQRMTDSPDGRAHWSTIDFCSTVGFAGKAFAQSEVEAMAFLLRAYYDEKPCDWIYPAHLAALTGRPALKYSTPLFQHNGKVRSIPRGA